LWGKQALLVTQLVERLWVGNGAGKIWHSTYYTMPSKWRGAQVVTVVDMIYELYPNLFNEPYDDDFRKQKRRAISQAAAVICISETTRRDVQQFYGLDDDKLFVVPLAHSESFRPGADDTSSAQRPFLLYVGKRIHYKNFELLLDAYSQWHANNEVDLILVTDSDWTPEERQRLTALNLTSRVQLLTHIDDERLRSLYSQALAFVYPSLYEGFGIPLLEAMACGCPVVASDIPSTREVAGDCAFYFDPSSAEDLRVVLDQVLANGSDSARRAAGIARANTFSWNETARGTLEVYRSVLG
jgi:glycosyltransferase involved in cell wall biosynthesis